MSTITCRDVTVFYPGTVILRDVSFTLNPGAGLALVGGNGCGKTTLLKAILGEVSTKGAITVLDAAPGRAPRGSIGYVPQANQLDPTFPITARNVVEMALKSVGRKNWEGKLHERATEALEIVGLKHKAKMRFGDLSGGQQQRVLVARALAVSPRLILLDEPFNGLDQDSRGVLIDVLNDLKKEGVSLVCSTHDMQLAEACCDYLGTIANKEITFSNVVTPTDPADGSAITQSA